MLAGTQDPEEYNLNTKLAKEVDKMLSEGLSKAKSVQLWHSYQLHLSKRAAFQYGSI